MTVTSRRRSNLDESPTYNHGVAPATPPLPYHAFAASRHHVAAQLVSMARYEDDELPCVNAQTSQMSADGQPREHSDSLDDDDTPTKRQKLHHPSSPGSRHACMITGPAPSAPYAGLPPGPARMNAPAKHFDMLPPPDSVHGSWQALHEYAQSHAAEHGYALSINTTAKNRSRIKLACVCYGQPKNTHKLTAETRVRKNRVSYKTGCKMWVEGKKLEDGTWLLRVGEPLHNHPGRDSAGWAVQRKRTWGLVGGRIGVGGVTAKEELAKRSQDAAEDAVNTVDGGDEYTQAKFPLERGGLVWKIVEQEMLRKNKPNHGRDRGVGRTVDVLQLRLPGIHILKRDVYNIRAQIKRARKAAGQQLGDGVDSSSDDDDDDDDDDNGGDDEADDNETHDTLATNPAGPPPKQSRPVPSQPQPLSASFSNPLPARIPARIDPSLNLHADNQDTTPPSQSPPDAASNTELEQLRRENAELRRLLADRTKEVKEKTIEMAGLRSQVELLSNIMLTSGRGMVPP
ncbi:hypothetical protein yc1106_01026 [Curvularia clavata]|uniref:FAR1 domain-containing protein n=1 Tax=Curvularia clavata TaxID=95742 RepID=A0A9Q8Z0F4_CURCL|nr:hypothetical protein yc1106_01026 [Curvularia clavata]